MEDIRYLSCAKCCLNIYHHRCYQQGGKWARNAASPHIIYRLLSFQKCQFSCQWKQNHKLCCKYSACFQTDIPPRNIHTHYFENYCTFWIITIFRHHTVTKRSTVFHPVFEKVPTWKKTTKNPKTNQPKTPKKQQKTQQQQQKKTPTNKESKFDSQAWLSI